ncbi:MAG: SoxR reducing system RseC family protein [Clostridia bacterium]|nr:SoxR reducing system RseC family protein [Clostridia bacterium]
MVRTGFVKDKKGDQLKVCFSRPEACEGCKGCAKGLVPKQELLTVFGQAEVGDMVDVEMPQAQTLKASVLVYALPLALLLAGLAGGYGAGLSDGVTLLLSLTGLALGSLAAWTIDKRLRVRPSWRPAVVNVYPMNTKKD